MSQSLLRDSAIMTLEWADNNRQATREILVF
jgi:hypothetical protein